MLPDVLVSVGRFQLPISVFMIRRVVKLGLGVSGKHRFNDVHRLVEGDCHDLLWEVIHATHHEIECCLVVHGGPTVRFLSRHTDIRRRLKGMQRRLPIQQAEGTLRSA